MDGLHGSSGDESADQAAKDLLIESSLPQVFDEYDYARQHGVVEPVVFLLDCEDELGSPMARAWEGDDAVDAAIQENVAEVGGRRSEVGTDDSTRLAVTRSGAPVPDESPGNRPVPPGRLITTLARAYSWSDCRREVPDVFPYLSATFESPPPTDGFVAVVVTAGGAATFTVPHSARPEEETD